MNIDLTKYNSLIMDLYTYYGENKELDQLIDNITDETLVLINNIKPLLSNKPVCVKCNSELAPMYYQGYYEEFPYWSCKCRDKNEFFTQNTRRGAYG